MTRRLAAALVALVALMGVAAPAPAAPLARDMRAISLVIGWDAATPAQVRAVIHELTGATVTAAIPEISVERVTASPAAQSIYLARPEVHWVEPEFDVRILDAPSDPLLHLQWTFDKLNVRKGWRHEAGVNNPVVVAVADTGIDQTHPDLGGRLQPGINFYDLQAEEARDNHGHGTHIAGVIAANSDNQLGITGMSWGAKVMPLKVCDKKGGCDGVQIAAAIVYAAVSGAKVVNLSLGGAGTECPALFQVAGTFARERGVVLVAASGNSGDGDNPIIYPAACEGFFGVGATDVNDDIAEFSSYGSWVDVSAPGVAVMSTLPPQLSRKQLIPGYGLASGTSMAAPHVAALAALLFSQHPEWTPDEVETRIEESSVDLGPAGRDDRFGAGRIDVGRALQP
ncbi:MAG TPA: S8 family serine peptidase [Actinomycetota bacterium]|nr:S8 family serine peptidase [Actinomycetota bacterium]